MSISDVSDVMLRREFLKKSATAGTGLVLGFYLPGKFEALAAAPRWGARLS